MKIGTPIKETIPYFLGRLAILSELEARKIWGYLTIAKFISKQEKIDLLQKLYGFDFKTFLGLVEN